MDHDRVTRRQLLAGAAAGAGITTLGRTTGEANTVSAYSRAFTIDWTRIRFRIAGSRAADARGEPLCWVGLYVDGEHVLKATGEGDETPRPVDWDVWRWRGCTALLTIVDDAGPANPSHVTLFGPVRAVEAEGLDRLVPDLAHGGVPVRVDPARVVDIVVLGDGYLADEESAFDQAVRSWERSFRSVSPYPQFAAAFRVRGCFTASKERVSADGRSYYGLSVRQRRDGNWWTNPTIGPKADRAISFALRNLRANRGPDGAVPVERGSLYAYVVILARMEGHASLMGYAAGFDIPDYGTVQMALGSGGTHEFTHSFSASNIGDEYILVADSVAPPSLRDAMLRNAGDLWYQSNISYSDRLSELPWRHLAPGSEINPDASSAVGRLWLGGNVVTGAWHSEPFCLMNGGSANWDMQRARRGAWLQSQQFCAWCHEIVTARIAALLGQLGDLKDGRKLWSEWGRRRPGYQAFFGVRERIERRSRRYAASGLQNAAICARPRE